MNENNSPTNLLTQETKLIICKYCQKPVTAYAKGYFDDRNRRWVDEQGRHLNGKCCGKCHQIKVRLNMRKLREKRAGESTNGETK